MEIEGAKSGDTQPSQAQEHPHSADNGVDYKHAAVEMDIDDAIEQLGMGRFQTEVLIAAGLCFAADAMEVLMLSFLAVVLQVEWDLSERQMDTIVSIVFAGAIIGTLILGPLGDRIGRKPVFSATAATIAIFGLGTAFVSDFKSLLIVRFIVGFGVGGLTVPFDCLAEFVPTSHRGSNLLYIEFFWTAGTLLIPVLAKLTIGSESNNNGDSDEPDQSWRWFVGLCAIPCVISVFLGVVYVPESPRWLLTQGRHDEAVKILRQAAFRNGKDGDVLFPEGTSIICPQFESTDDSISALFSPKWLRTTMHLWGAWFGLAFLYYGAILLVSIVFSSHEVDDGTYEFDYSAIFISGSSEVVGLIIVLLTIDEWGRIASQSIFYILGGTTCLVLGYSAQSDSPRKVLIIFSFLARLFMMGATCTTWVSTSEILSTEIRATGHSAANAMARLGAFFAPYIISSGTSSLTIGFVMFGIGILTAAVAFQLPETAGKPLGGVVEDQRSSAMVTDDGGIQKLQATSNYSIM